MAAERPLHHPPSGPLVGVRVIELGGIGPAPFCGMVLADMGADVVQVSPSPPSVDEPAPPLWNRGRRSVHVDLKSDAGRDRLGQLVDAADALIEGFRPGVAERLGVDPHYCLARNPRLVYGRVTGWGQDGPLAAAAGHDLNFLALSGALWSIGRSGELPVPPLNLVGDFGGGGMLLAVGVCAALLHASRTGEGQVVDTAMVEGAAQLTTSIHGLRAQGRWNDERGTNLLDGGAPFYDVYRTSDDRLVAVAALEGRFFAELVRRLGLEGDPVVARRMDAKTWPAMRARFTAIFAERPLAHWCAELEGTDSCFSPVLDPANLADHPHNRARETFVQHAGSLQPAPAPRFSATPAAIQRPAPRPGEHTDEVFREWTAT